MQRFSQRIGKTPIQETIQIDTMTESFKNRLFNALEDRVLTSIVLYNSSSGEIKRNFLNLYAHYFGIYIGDIPNFYNNFIAQIKNKIYQNNDIYFFYDLIELLAEYIANFSSPEDLAYVFENITNVFKLEKSAFRFDVDYQLIKITDEIELEEINTAIKVSSQYSGVEKHLNNARGFFSNREKPNYNKTISESIDAVESLCKILLNDDKATLGKAVKELNLHTALEKSIAQLYGFASDESGIRHSNKSNGKDIDEHTARFILVTCHSIVNYLIAEKLPT